MTVRDQVIKTVQNLGDAECQQVAEYLAFLKFRSRYRHASEVDATELGSLYTEFSSEDRELAEQGMTEYVEGLCREDEG